MCACDRPIPSAHVAVGKELTQVESPRENRPANQAFLHLVLNCVGFCSDTTSRGEGTVGSTAPFLPIHKHSRRR